MAGAIFLGIIAIFPTIARFFTNIQNLILGGTGILIVVSVVLETIKAIEAQLVMRNYEGFKQNENNFNWNSRFGKINTRKSAFAKNFQIPYLSTGHIFREIAKEQTPLGEFIAKNNQCRVSYP